MTARAEEVGDMAKATAEKEAATIAAMRMTYDAEADALAVELLPGARSVRTQRLGPLERLDFDADDRLIAVEVLKASTRYPREALDALAKTDEELTLLECKQRTGIDPSALRHQLAAGKLYGEKRGRDWIVRASDLEKYLRGRAPVGRRAELPKYKRRRRSS